MNAPLDFACCPGRRGWELVITTAGVDKIRLCGGASCRARTVPAADVDRYMLHVRAAFYARQTPLRADEWVTARRFEAAPSGLGGDCGG